MRRQVQKKQRIDIKKLKVKNCIQFCIQTGSKHSNDASFLEMYQLHFQQEHYIQEYVAYLTNHCMNAI